LTLLDIVDEVHRWLNVCQHERLHQRMAFITNILLPASNSRHHLATFCLFAVNRNKLATNFRSSFSFRVKKSNYCTNRTFRGHFKHTARTTSP
jgi:hypothetical protein